MQSEALSGRSIQRRIEAKQRQPGANKVRPEPLARGIPRRHLGRGAALLEGHRGRNPRAGTQRTAERPDRIRQGRAKGIEDGGGASLLPTAKRLCIPQGLFAF
jgi:hypothetical protein